LTRVSEQKPTMANSESPFVIGISSVSGGGKTATARMLAELLQNAITLCFDDYDDSNIHPENRQAWLKEGGDYNAWKTPTLTKDLQALKTGNPITSVLDGSLISPARFIIFDAPLGREHCDSGRFIDFMVFIDTPLDIAMARRVLRDLSDKDLKADDTLKNLEENLSSYLNEGRPIYLHFENHVKQTSDLILDGCLPLDELAMEIYTRVVT